MASEPAHIISIFLVIAGVGVIVLGFFKNIGRQIQKIKIEKFGINAELSTMGLGLSLGFLLSMGGAYVYLQSRVPAKPEALAPVKLNVSFEPNEVNPRHPKFQVKAFMKASDGSVESLPVLPRISLGSLSVEVTVPDKDAPFFIIFTTPSGIWKTDDHSMLEAHVGAYKIDSQ